MARLVYVVGRQILQIIVNELLPLTHPPGQVRFCKNHLADLVAGDFCLRDTQLGHCIKTKHNR